MRVEIEWRRLDEPAVEHATMSSDADGQILAGVVEGTTDHRAYRIRYTVRCTADWMTRRATVQGNIGDEQVDLEIGRTETGAWTLNGAPQHQIDRCVDVDLGFSPITNTLAIRRLNLDVGRAAIVRAAWLRFPDLAFQVLEQRYERVGESRYIYESDNGRFRAELEVDAEGIVVRYDRYWIGSVR